MESTPRAVRGVNGGEKWLAGGSRRRVDCDRRASPRTKSKEATITRLTIEVQTLIRGNKALAFVAELGGHSLLILETHQQATFLLH